MKIDLHCHTIKTKKSDGVNRNVDVETFSNYMKDLDIKIVAITNHNYFDLKQYNEFSERVKENTMIWPGIELNIKQAPKDGHMIVICDPKNKDEFSKIFDMSKNKADDYSIDIKEPFATLLMHNIKHIETRSWKTNYRGELYIHASGKSLAKEYLKNDVVNELIKNMEMNYGNIICKGILVDCIYMDEKYVNEMKKNKVEYYCGAYEVGRYAWVFENIEQIYPIPAKGHLNIWNCEENEKTMAKSSNY